MRLAKKIKKGTFFSDPDCFRSPHMGFKGVRSHTHKSKPVQPANWPSITLTTHFAHFQYSP